MRKLVGGLVVAALAATFVVSPSANAAPRAAGEVTPEAMASALFGAYVRVHERGPDLDKHFVMSVETLGWRKRNPNATADQVKEHLATVDTTIKARLTAVDWQRTQPELVGRMVEAVGGPDLADPAHVLVGRDLLQWVGKIEDRISGAQEQFSTGQGLYDLQTRTWAQVAERARTDAAFRDGWNGHIGDRLGVDAAITAEQLATKPKLTAMVNVRALLDASGDPTALQTVAQEQVNAHRAGIDTVKAESVTIAKSGAAERKPGEATLLSEVEIKTIKEKGEAREEKIAAAKAGITGLTEFTGLWFPEASKKIGTFGKAAADIADAFSKFATAAKVMGTVSAIGSLASVALTGNVLGAISSVVGLFMSGPDPNAMIMEEIGKLKQDIADLRKEMNEQFQRIDKRLTQMYDSIIAELGKIKADVADIKTIVQAVAHEISRLQSQVQTYGVATLKAVGDVGMRDLMTAANEYVDYKAKYNREIADFLTYTHSAENPIQLAGSQVPSDAAYTLPFEQYKTADVNSALDLYGSTGLLGYLLYYGNQWQTMPVPAAKSVGNPAVWQLGANAWAKLSDQNPGHAGEIAAFRGEQVAAAGQDILNAAAHLSTPDPDPEQPLNGLFRGLTGSYDNAMSRYTEDITRVARDKVLADAGKNFQLFGPPTQRPAGGGEWPVADAPDKMQACGGGRELVRPANLRASDIGPAAKFARYIHNGLDFQYCWGTLHSDHREENDPHNTYYKTDIQMIISSQMKTPDGSVISLRNTSAIVYRDFTYRIKTKTGQIFDYSPDEWVHARWPSCCGSVHMKQEFENTATAYDIQGRDALIAEQMTEYLKAKKLDYYNRAIERTTTAAHEVNTALRLLRTYTEVGLPRALESDDQLKALLSGEYSLQSNLTDEGMFTAAFTQAVNNIHAKQPPLHQQRQTGTCTAPPDPALDPVLSCLNTVAHERLGRLTAQYAKHFAKIKAKESIQTAPAVEATVRHVRMINNRVHLGKPTDKQNAQAAVDDAITLSNSGKHQEAATKVLEGVHIAREITKTEPAYAETLGYWIRWPASGFLTSAGRFDEGVALLGEAVVLYRRLGELEPQNVQHRMNQADALVWQGYRLSAKGDHALGREKTLEAMNLARPIAAENTRHGETMGFWIRGLSSHVLVNAGQPDEAIALLGEAAVLYRRLDELEPQNHYHRMNQADALVWQGYRLSAKGDHALGREKTLEAMNLARPIVAENPRHAEAMGFWIRGLSSHVLVNAGQVDEAVALLGEAVALYRRLDELEPQNHYHRINQADTLMWQGFRLWGKGEHGQARDKTLEGIAVIRPLAAENPAWANQLGQMLGQGVNYADGTGRRDQAIALAKEAVEVYVKLNETDPARYGPSLENAKKQLEALQQ